MIVTVVLAVVTVVTAGLAASGLAVGLAAFSRRHLGTMVGPLVAFYSRHLGTKVPRRHSRSTC